MCSTSRAGCSPTSTAPWPKAHRLELENERLQVEKRAQATPLRVEKLAREKLQMRSATPAITSYATYSEPAAPDTGGIGTPARAATGVVK
jgi:cell division protein FtsL